MMPKIHLLCRSQGHESVKSDDVQYVGSYGTEDHYETVLNHISCVSDDDEHQYH